MFSVAPAIANFLAGNYLNKKVFFGTIHFSRHIWWYHTWDYFMPSLELNFNVLLLIILHANQVA
jgi:hypothetical protein